MKFGLVLPRDETGDAGTSYDSTFRACERAEELGFDFAVLPHHHFSVGFPSAPLVLLGALASRTSRLRLGTNILILPNQHPLVVAEQLATVDVLSGGRVFLGAGMGYRPYEFEVFGVPFSHRRQRMDEALEVLGQVLSGQATTFAGAHFAFENVTLAPRPVQRPRPPIWVGATTRRGVERAGRLGDGWTTDSKQTLPQLKGLVDHYREIAASLGRPSSLCLARDVGVAATRAAVESEWLPRVRMIFRYYAQSGLTWQNDPVAQRVWQGEDVGLTEFARDRLVAGSPADCVTAIERWIEHLGCDYMLVRLSYGPNYDFNALEVFGREVLPAFAD